MCYFGSVDSFLTLGVKDCECSPRALCDYNAERWTIFTPLNEHTLQTNQQ